MINDPATAATTTRCDVFFSYARGDRALAERLASGLVGQGLSVAIDRTHISFGEDWSDRLEMLLRNASKVVFLVVSRIWWKFPGDVFRACEGSAYQAARSSGIGSIG